MNLRPPGYELPRRPQSAAAQRFEAFPLRKIRQNLKVFSVVSAGKFPVLGQVMGHPGVSAFRGTLGDNFYLLLSPVRFAV